MPHHGNGPIPSRIMLVGEAWGAEEERTGQPFAGIAGQELNRMLHEAGVLSSECYQTNLVNHRPPGNDLGFWIAMKKKDITLQHVMLQDKHVLPQVVEGHRQLLLEIEMVKPNLIVALGNWALWALTGLTGIRNWRGSLLRHEASGAKVIPTFHPSAVLREWSLRSAAVNDLKRAARHLQNREYQFPEFNFILAPTYDQVLNTLDFLSCSLKAGEELWIDLDLETSSGHIACCGLSWSRTDAICIPFITRGKSEGYWTEDEEVEIIWQLYRILTHPNVKVRWQNGLYDAQYICRHWLFTPRGAQDTMISQHSIFSDQPKSLAYQASIYAEHYVFWKDEGKQLAKGGTEEQHWRYNCLDCIYTREVGEVELQIAAKLGLQGPHDFQQEMFWPVLRAMTLGIRVRIEERDRLAAEIQEQISHREQFLVDLLGHPINPRSSLQMQKLFYEDLQQPPIRTRPKKGVPGHLTCDDEALQKIASREPLLKPIINCISDIRTLEIFLGSFILARLDVDNRMRCSFNIGGSESGKSAPKTFRLSSSKNAFGGGANLQTIPSEKSKSVGKAMARGHVALLGDPYHLPNIRSMFGPDEGKTFFDMDLDRADLYAMAWDADESVLKEVLKKKVDLHLFNAFLIKGKEPPDLLELVESHPKYPDHRGPMKHDREFAKVFAHATDYLGKARTVAAATGRTVAEIERSQKRYLGAYKGIKLWQDRVIEQVRRHRFVENAFGYRWYIFDRIDDQVMPEAVAWIPQSTVSIVINKIWANLYKNAPEVEVLLQVHDSLAGQFPTHRKAECLAAIQEQAKVIVPYPDPLIIPIGIGTSEVSWGEC